MSHKGFFGEKNVLGHIKKDGKMTLLSFPTELKDFKLIFLTKGFLLLKIWFMFNQEFLKLCEIAGGSIFGGTFS